VKPAASAGTAAQQPVSFEAAMPDDMQAFIEERT
jgi:hypothetical protein